jgi:hypothetical protein
MSTRVTMLTIGALVTAADARMAAHDLVGSAYSCGMIPRAAPPAGHGLRVLAKNTNGPLASRCIRCALRTGMRLGELLGLQWGDIDFQGRFIEVRRSLVEGGRIELPKNGKIRRVDLSLLLGETLEKLRVRRAEEAPAKGWKQVPEWVFCNEEGRPIWKSDFERRVFHKALEKARLRRIRFHDLRHTFASRLLQNGESIVYVKDQLGHHSIKVTVDVYGHLVPGANKAAVDRLDQQALAALAALEARNPAQPPRNLEPSEHTRGVTDRSVTPRQDLVELRGLEPLTPRLPALCSPN